MSNSVQPQRWQPTRLPHPWDSPGKNTRHLIKHLFIWNIFIFWNQDSFFPHVAFLSWVFESFQDLEPSLARRDPWWWKCPDINIRRRWWEPAVRCEPILFSSHLPISPVLPLARTKPATSWQGSMGNVACSVFWEISSMQWKPPSMLEAGYRGPRPRRLKPNYGDQITKVMHLEAIYLNHTVRKNRKESDRLTYFGASLVAQLVKKSARNVGDLSLIPGLGISPGEGIGYPFKYSWASLVAQMIKNLPAMRETCRISGFNSWVRRSPGGGYGNSLQYSCLENPHEQRNLVGYSPWGRKESDVTERLSTARHSTQLGWGAAGWKDWAPRTLCFALLV